MQRIQCQHCDECFELTDGPELREHLKFHNLEAIRVQFLEKDISESITERISEKWDMFAGHAIGGYDLEPSNPYDEDLEVIQETPGPVPIRVEQDLWETSSAWNSMNKSMGND